MFFTTSEPCRNAQFSRNARPGYRFWPPAHRHLKCSERRRTGPSRAVNTSSARSRVEVCFVILEADGLLQTLDRSSGEIFSEDWRLCEEGDRGIRRCHTCLAATLWRRTGPWWKWLGGWRHTCCEADRHNFSNSISIDGDWATCCNLIPKKNLFCKILSKIN